MNWCCGYVTANLEKHSVIKFLKPSGCASPKNLLLTAIIMLNKIREGWLQHHCLF